MKTHTWILRARDHEYSRYQCDRCGTVKIAHRDQFTTRYRLASGLVTIVRPACGVVEFAEAR